MKMDGQSFRKNSIYEWVRVRATDRSRGPKSGRFLFNYMTAEAHFQGAKKEKESIDKSSSLSSALIDLHSHFVKRSPVIQELKE